MPASNSNVNMTLTNYARGFAQDKGSALAEFIAPTVPTATKAGQFKSFDDKNAFQIYDTARAVGGNAKRIEFGATDPFYNCTPQALEIAIDDDERAGAGEGDPLGIERAKSETLVTSAVASHEDKVFKAIAANVTATSSVGVWSDETTNDPIAEIDAQIKSISDSMGMMPNRIAMGLSAWQIIRSHQKVINRQPGAQLIGLTLAQFSAMLLNPGIEARLGILSKDTAKFGKVASKVNVVGAEVYVFYGASSPTIYDPSFAKTFSMRQGGVESVRLYREEKSRSDILAVDWSEDIKVVSTVSVRRITVS